MLTLLTYPAGCGQFSLSPFCVKAAYLLQKSEFPWKREDLSDPRNMPHAKLPVLRTDAGLIPDSEGIRLWLQKQGIDFDAGLTEIQKANAHALIRMAEDHIYFHLVMERWLNDAVWPTIRETYFASIPGLLRKPITEGIRRTLRKGYKIQGIGRFSRQERLGRLDRDLGALRVLLKQSPFLFGDNPTSADFSVVPMLAAIRGTPVQTEVTRRVDDDRVFTDYLGRMEKVLPLP